MPSFDLTLPLTGARLREALYLDRAAVDNWARYAQGPDEYDRARAALLAAIEDEGVMTDTHPEWMTSPKKNVDLWVHFPSGVALTVRRDDRPGVLRPLRVTNALAPRRGARRATAPKVTVQAAAPAEMLIELERASSVELADLVHLSVHCADRLRERAGAGGEDEHLYDQLRAAISRDGQGRSVAPAWADASGLRGPAVMTRWNNETLALPLKLNTNPTRTRPWVATTCLAERWVREDLLDRRGEELAERLHLSSAAVEAWTRQRSGSLRERIVAAGCARVGEFGGLELEVDDLHLRIRPTSTTQQAAGMAAYLLEGALDR